jgi:hypothetical protein
VVSASYAGNRGVKLFGGNYDLNQLDPSNFALRLGLQDQVPNPFYGQIASGALSGRTTTRSQTLRPYPDYLGVATFANHGGSSTYHSFQLTAERRFANGFSAQIAYTNSKLINDSFSSVGNQQGGDYRIGRLNRALERAIDQDDISQRLVMSGIYELPFGKATRSLVKHAIGGWQINTITTIETGSPLSVRGASNFTGINWPDVLRDPTLPAGERTLNRWFDTDAFRNPADFTIGNVPRTLPNTRGPGYFDVALSFFKVFPIRERKDLEFRAEFFNALNHVNPNAPNTTFQPNAEGMNRNANFGKILSALDARRVQFGLRLAF